MQGIYVPLVTPFTRDGEVAATALAGLAHDVLSQGAAGLVALGTTAETATLDAAERRTVLDVCAEACRQGRRLRSGRERGAALIVGVGTNDTRASAAALRELGDRPEVAAALVPVPYYTRPSEAGVLAHFAALAAGSPVPLLVYHIPYRSGQDLGVEALRRLAAHPRIAGVKYAAGGIGADTVTLLADPPADFAVLAGDDVFASPMLALGAAGGILASAHIGTRSFVGLGEAWRDGDAGRARALGNRLARLSAALFTAPSPTVLKGVLHAQGRIPTAAVRLPLVPAPREAVTAALPLAELA